MKVVGRFKFVAILWLGLGKTWSKMGRHRGLIGLVLPDKMSYGEPWRNMDKDLARLLIRGSGVRFPPGAPSFIILLYPVDILV